jgi:exopolysaccharide production protein ExoY
MTVPFPNFDQSTHIHTSKSLYAAFGKRVFDIAMVLISAPIVLPVLLVICLAAWAQGGKPFYTQRRIGVNGREFLCWKIRTMVRDADAVLAAMIASDPKVAQEWALNQKLSNDPRITRLGRFLRRTSLDELPQLLNVLNGTMSLVGPRPFMPDQRNLYSSGSPDAAYYRLRPGISGLWQVSRRNAGSFGEREHFDEDYSARMGLGFDLWILWRTCTVVLRATGI